MTMHILLHLWKKNSTCCFVRVLNSVSLTLREEHRLKVSENRMLRRVFGPKREEVTRDWRKPHNEELHQILLRRTNHGG
jgi:hypothetical protein